MHGLVDLEEEEKFNTAALAQPCGLRRDTRLKGTHQNARNKL
jgi:hypothetical protein